MPAKLGYQWTHQDVSFVELPLKHRLLRMVTDHFDDFDPYPSRCWAMAKHPRPCPLMHFACTRHLLTALFLLDHSVPCILDAGQLRAMMKLLFAAVLK
jgi:hypothetical protein